MSKRITPEDRELGAFQVMRSADAAFLFVDEPSVRAELVEALRADGWRVTTGSDELVVSRASGKLDVLALASIVREKKGATTVIVPVSRLERAASPGPRASGPAKQLNTELQTRRGKLTIELVPSVVALDGQPIRLTRIEALLLGRLWQALGHSVSVEALIAAAWPDEPASVKALRVHLSKLRPKLAVLGLKLETHKNRGYRLELVPPEPGAPKLVRERPAPRYRRIPAGVVIPISRLLPRPDNALRERWVSEERSTLVCSTDEAGFPRRRALLELDAGETTEG